MREAQQAVSNMVSGSSVSAAPPPGMLLVPGGSFVMGCETGAEFESPAHEVHLDAFFIDSTPVTNRQFVAFAEATGFQTSAEREGSAWGFRNGQFHRIAGLSWRSYATGDRADHPVVLVSWLDADAYAQWIGGALPSEAQWEYAARGGGADRTYPWGDDAPDESKCNFARKPAVLPQTTTSGAFPPNAFGLYDMVGNVWQWCRDWYDPHAYAAAAARNPEGPQAGQVKVRRGGAWNVLQPFRLRSANRGAMPPAACAPNLGFRCVFEAGGESRVSAVAGTDRQHGLQVAQGNSHVSELLHSDPRIAEVAMALGELRPAMQADGGDVEVVAVEDGVVHLRLQGTCRVCPSASLTLTVGLERTLRQRLPWVRRVARFDPGAAQG